ncbi:lysine-specific demethylase lid isoform X3 [Ostrinia furnacalis]|uniref:lysine-specific demethylase lid isoform X1 n=1 Tax=Ostrinia furnacalis TaxID=93504 RepID=UPI00103A6938|nr:lysine-specific demethylase lid isoform X1 [Ostrinia furnacalis]XP_028172032.1 lysine-specific demethylase lid isoform X2 [Ostrinia furnacalis]XP_028172033.1 lysine-specific demethylase lid isoform X3 [Ostrinia furnacalis]
MGKCDEANVEVSMGDSASPMKPDNFTFTVPPEAPVFEPTPEEFLDPLAYISKIRPIAEKSGICKIKPPAHWQPPFAVDVDRLRFTPRIQRLNELEAITRVKLNFLDQIIKFWELQGSVLKIPTVERKPLDLYALHKIVREAGGFEVCSAERKWSKIARRMGHPQGKGIGSILKSHYERILYPYDVFKSSGVSGDNKETKIEVKTEQTPEKANSTGRSRSASKGPPAAATPPPARRYEPAQPEGATPPAPPAPRTPVKQEPPAQDTRRSPRENKWMSAAGSCGGRARVTRSTRLREHRMSNMTVSVTPAPNAPHLPHPDDPLAKYMCHVCGRGDIEEQMLLCDGCDDSYHTFCLVPPLADVPKGDWRCPVCLAEEVSKPAEAFGFEQASREYTLQQFGEMADQFKSDYFNMPVHMVPTSTVEKEFWRVVSSIDEDVTVEYGADLHSMDHGSGFPTKSSAHLYPGEQQYAECSWNLNNLPVLEGSVLGHINADISGMKVPWLYVGMCFATFCWHNEDHWSYSINYLHWGEPKTWYGVPSSKAEQFEAAMKSEAPELFQLQPDLLHQLVTIMNPNVLMKAGVPVFRTDQHAGEFVITFPRAYHAGFNQGYNFAEAVNFTPADWLKMGRECIAHYSTLRRYCVFSHDELVCKMALEANALSVTVALAAYRDMRTMLHDERKLRKGLLDWGVTEAEREAFELLPDDERQCHLCKTTCFLSCVTCSCTPHVACLRHYQELCDCAPHLHRLRYRYTLDELPAMLDKLKKKSELFREWAEAVQNALDPDTPKTCDLDGLRAHLKKAHDLKMHKTDLVRALETAIEDAEKCASVIQQLDLNKMRTRTRHHDPKYRLTIHELTLFAAEIDGLACVLPEGSAVKEVLRQTAEFETRAAELLNQDLDKVDASSVRELEEVVELGSRLCIVLPQLAPLQARLQQARFLQDVQTHREDSSGLTPEVIDRLLEDASRVLPHHQIETERAALCKLKAQVEEWEERARALLIDTSKARDSSGSAPGEGAGSDGNPPYTTLGQLAALLAAAERIDAALPSHHALHSAAQHARDWLAKVEEMQSKDLYPYMHSVEALVRRGQQIPLALFEKDQLASALQSAREWKRGAAEMFLKKNWPYSLLEALSPRTESASGARRRSRPPAAEPPPSSLEAGLFLRHFSEDSTPSEIVGAFKQAESRELAAIKLLRAKNMRKEVRAAPTLGVTYCVCQKRQYGVMSQCELCKDWFHAACIAANKEERAESPDRVELPFPRPEPKFLCPDCTRTKRPRLDRILALLVWLQKLPVRLAEGEALQCVTERAMAWQDAARALLASPALAALPAHAERPQTNREKSDKLNAELKKATGRAHDVSQNSRSSASVEHAYSATPRSPGARVAPGLLHKLEELMLEGDLLEVRLEEQAQVWACVCAARGAETRRARVDAGRRKRAQRPPRPHHQLKRGRAAHALSPAASHVPHPTTAPKTTLKRGSATTTNYLNRKQGMSSGSGLMMRKHYMARQERRKRGLAASTRGKHPRQARLGQPRGGSRAGAAAPRRRSSSSSSSADDDEDCAAADCLRPTGKEVDWVQCDGGCDQWFHMHCVGLSRGALREDDDYVCGSCAARPRH